jgi:aminocarboxymuconate-semialdehyde decarboxylase
MDKFGEGYCQILTVPAPPPEVLAGPDKSPDLARAANDGLAELCRKYPDRFPSFAATLPMNNMAACVDEIHRAIGDLGACGVEFCTNAAGKPMDLPEFEPVYQIMAEQYDLPIFVHPVRPAGFSDYRTEDKSKFEIWWVFGWPYETAAFMSRVVFAGYFDKYPNLKIITHHLGGMVPFSSGRIGPGWDQLGSRTSDEDLTGLLKQLKKRPVDYFKMFYADTAVFGGEGATECGLKFFGVDHVVFASDSPFDPEGGEMYIRETIKILDELEISEDDRAKIYHKNAERILKLA